MTKNKFKGKNNNNYKQGKYCIPHYCMDCNKLLNKGNAYSKRCRKCADRQHGIDMRKSELYKGKNNPNYKHGLSKNRFFYVKFRRKTDINYRIKELLRNRITKALKHQKKSNKTEILIGCSLKKLKSYLQKQFKKGMSWKTYGFYGWHIDHIRPCALFDLSKISEQKKCFHYTNLQPLWAKKHKQKTAKELKLLRAIRKDK